jgi:hypothetical protein
MQPQGHHEQLSYTLFGVFAASFSCSAHLHPAGAPELGRDSERPHNSEDFMRSITQIVLPIILAAGVSGLIFTATLV